MIFRFRGKDFDGANASEIVRALEREEHDYISCGGPIRQYLMWSLHQLNGSVPPRDLDLSDRLDDETLSFGYLLLLDEYGIGQLKNDHDR